LTNKVIHAEEVTRRAKANFGQNRRSECAEEVTPQVIHAEEVTRECAEEVTRLAAIYAF
jgi:hypothetical protein